MRLIIISGRSGSGKTSALQVLEDLNFYCVDNLPASLLPELAKHIQPETENTHGQGNIAVSIDARNPSSQLAQFPQIFNALDKKLNCSIMYLDASEEVLLRRFISSKRKHPLSNEHQSLKEALDQEAEILAPIETLASKNIDTSYMTIHQLRELIKQDIFHKGGQHTAILLQSFSYKHGIPVDTDLVFDVRCLKNPHWVSELKDLTGQDQAVKDYLSSDKLTQSMVKDISDYFLKWLPEFEANNRSYLTLSIGCTGGQHRSVFVCEAVAKKLQGHVGHIQVRHRQLGTAFNG